MGNANVHGRLIQACQKGDLEGAKTFLRLGASATAYYPQSGYTALHYAAARGHLSIVKLLLVNGANPLQMNKNEQTPLELARVQEHKEVQEYIDLFIRSSLWVEANQELLASESQSSTDNAAVLPEESRLVSVSDKPPHSGNLSSSRSATHTNSMQVESSELVSLSGTHEQRVRTLSVIDTIPELHTRDFPFKILPENMIGEGGFGKVFKTQHLRTGEPVVMKIFTGPDAVQHQDFMKEWNKLSKLKHANIVQVFEQYSDSQTNLKAYTMELMDKSLNDLLLSDKLSISHALYISLEIVKGLIYLHDNGLVHNDLKPRNVLLRKKDGKIEVKLCDFGASSYRDNVARSSTRIEMTQPYAAPERLDGGRYSQSADVYSFGILLNQLLTGEKPYPNLEFVGLYAHVVKKQKRPNVATGIPKSLRDLIVQCWSADAEARPRMSKMRCVLEDLCDCYPLVSNVERER